MSKEKMQRLSVMDDAFLRIESRRQPLHIGMLMLFEPPPDGGDDFAAKLAERLKESTRAVAPFNHHLVRRRGRPYRQETEEVDLAHPLVHLSFTRPGHLRAPLTMVS